jgi:superfamily II RNA helicase
MTTTTNYDTHYESFSFPLSPFQKQAIQAIVDGSHALVCAPTGSGKTLPAEFAIRHFTSLGKRVIYCSPIKALSNQKMYEFGKKYGDTISFGLLTGDIKTNPGAQVLIMTTEILMNKLFLIETAPKASGEPLTPDLSGAPLTSAPSAQSLTFDIDLENDLGAVVFDEVHMINSPDRGHVWEKCIMMLPSHVQMVMLSATLDNPQRFANWVRGTGTKEVVLCQTHTRIVPLTHYMYLTTGEGFYKKLGDKEAERRVRDSVGKCRVLQDAANLFNVNTYRETANILKLQFENRVFLKRKAVLNDLFAHLKASAMLPAITFVFSRKNVEMCAEELTVPLLDDDVAPVPAVIKAQCDSILRRLPNWREYAGLPEYETLVRLLGRGIGIHHSGMIPVFREIVEFMIAEKRVVALFATESFAIGLDCPIKTAVFISLKKPDGGESMRYLLPHEYTQMAGRAGRRGLDTVGNVVLCANLFELPSVDTFKDVLSGRPQTLTSKFKIYYPMILNWLSRTKTAATIQDFVGFVEDSMLQDEIDAAERGLNREIEEIEHTVCELEEGFIRLMTPKEKLAEYVALEERAIYAANKKRKEIDAEIKIMVTNFPELTRDLVHYRQFVHMGNLLVEKQKMLANNSKYVRNIVINLVSVLLEHGILKVYESIETSDELVSDISDDQDDRISEAELSDDEVINEADSVETCYVLTEPKGIIASRIAEIHPVLLANVCPLLMDMDSVELAATLSLFTDVRVHEDIRIYPGFTQLRIYNAQSATSCSFISDDRVGDLNVQRCKYISDNHRLNDMLCEFNCIKEDLILCESRANINMPDSGLDRHCYDIVDYVAAWCECEDEGQCRNLIRRLEEEAGISVGDFSKALLKISTVSRELMAMCDAVKDDSMVEFAHRLSKVDGLVLKYIATNQSLYL